MENTVIVLKDIRGEYDDSQDVVVGIYIIDKPNFDLQSEFCKYLKDFYEANGLEALIVGEDEYQYVCLRHLQYNLRKEYKGRIVELNRKVKELHKQHKGLGTIQHYVENVLKLKKLENVKEIYI